jgi:hypothetical protein
MKSNKVESELNWEVVTSPVVVNGVEATKYKALTRSDNGHIINIAKNSYTPTFNSRLIEVVEKLHDSTGMEIEGYSVMHNGAKILGYLKAEQGKELCGWTMDNYMVVGNSHDGSSGFFLGGVNNMIRCANQWSKVVPHTRIHHTKNHDLKIDEIMRYFDMYKLEQEAMYRKLTNYRNVKIDEKIKLALVDRLLKIESGKEESVELSTRKKADFENLMASIDRETKVLGQNAFGLFQGVTHYTTHVMNVRESVFGNVIGSKAIMNDKAMAFVDSLV